MSQSFDELWRVVEENRRQVEENRRVAEENLERVAEENRRQVEENSKQIDLLVDENRSLKRTVAKQEKRIAGLEKTIAKLDNYADASQTWMKQIRKDYNDLVIAAKSKGLI